MLHTLNNVKMSMYVLIMYSVLSFFLMFKPLPANADQTIRDFTRSISSIYIASKSCEHTIEPSPKEYIEVILTYLLKLYPSGVSYWVVPENVKIVSDPITCVSIIQNHLIRYMRARNDYVKIHPNRNPPPILVAYQWRGADYEPEPAVPTKSYNPKIKPKIIKEKFSPAQQSLQ